MQGGAIEAAESRTAATQTQHSSLQHRPPGVTRVLLSETLNLTRTISLVEKREKANAEQTRQCGDKPISVRCRRSRALVSWQLL